MDNFNHGILVFALRSALGDCTSGGVTSKYTTFVLSGPGIPKLFAPTKDIPVLFLEKNRYGYRAVPDSDPRQAHAKWGPMFGGNFVWTSDSRFQDVCGGPVAVHDRFEY